MILETACFPHENRMNIDIRGVVHAHLLGEGATHPSRPPSGAFNRGFQDDFVIPAKAGIQERLLETTVSGFPLSRE